MTARGYGSKSDLEAEIEDLDEWISDLEASRDEIRRLLGTAYVGPHKVLLDRMTYDKIMELS